MCEGQGVLEEEKRKGSTPKLALGPRGKISVVLMVEEGMSMADTARAVGVITPATWCAIRK